MAFAVPAHSALRNGFHRPPPPLPTEGLNLLMELLVMFAGSSVATQFHQAFYTQLVQEIFAVMTGGCRLMVQAWKCAGGCSTATCC